MSDRTVRIDYDLDYLLENDNVIEMIAKQNNITSDQLRQMFTSAIANGITTLNQYNDSHKA